MCSSIWFTHPKYVNFDLIWNRSKWVWFVFFFSSSIWIGLMKWNKFSAIWCRYRSCNQFSTRNAWEKPKKKAKPPKNYRTCWEKKTITFSSILCIKMHDCTLYAILPGQQHKNVKWHATTGKKRQTFQLSYEIKRNSLLSFFYHTISVFLVSHIENPLSLCKPVCFSSQFHFHSCEWDVCEWWNIL